MLGQLPSPSHAVGSELKDIKNYTKEDWQDFLSLSHTVGLEPEGANLQRGYKNMSPSHTVGSELLSREEVESLYKQAPSHTVGL